MEERIEPPDPPAHCEATSRGPAEIESIGDSQTMQKETSVTHVSGEEAKPKPAATSLEDRAEADSNTETAKEEPDQEPGSSKDTTSRSDEPISFKEGFVQLVAAWTNEENSSDQNEAIILSLILRMFPIVFEQHEVKELSEEESHYPNLHLEEIKGLVGLFKTAVIQHDGTIQQWQRMLRELTAAIYRSKDLLLEAIALKTSKLKVQHARTENPWSHDPLLDTDHADKDEPMEEEHSPVVRFKTSVYSAEEIAIMRQEFETPYDFPTTTQAPTEVEMKITQGLLEGTILAQELPQFLKRSTSNRMMRVIQNTIHVQMEGELMFRLPDDFPVYPNFQTRDRMCDAMLQGAKRRGFGMEQLTQMLGETKQVWYNAQQHSVHLIYWTREAANKWAGAFKSVPFRNHRFLIINVHPTETSETGTATEQAARVWGRQVGRDGITNERQHERCKIKLLNVSRFIDEANLDAFLHSKFQDEFITFQEPSWGRQTCQTGVWELYFRYPGCPKFLEGVRFISWIGTKILVHHAGSSPAAPYYNCGKHGHTAVQCKASSDYWKAEGSCINVAANDIKELTKDTSTVTSFQELVDMWNQLHENPSPCDPAGSEEENHAVSDEQQEESKTAHEPEGNQEWFSPSSRRRHDSTNQQPAASDDQDGTGST